MTRMTRRDWLARMTAGTLALGMGQLRDALANGSVAGGVARVRGDVRINGQPAKRGMEVKPGDAISTGPGSELVAVIGRDAFMARANTRVEFEGRAAQAAISGLRVLTGALLSVFAPGEPKRIRTSTATVGIRGTAAYVEIDKNRTYVCTCYGEAELVPVDEPKEAETVRTTHHDQPRYIYAKGMPRMIEKAPVINHTDAELVLLESLVGRKVPFDPSRY